MRYVVTTNSGDARAAISYVLTLAEASPPSDLR
jgi:hypothetical protein